MSAGSMLQLPQLLRPAPDAGATRPDAQTGAGRYVRSFLVERLIIGSLGVLLPVMTVFIDWGRSAASQFRVIH